MKFSKGQFSTYIKPFIVIIFALLLIFLVQRVLQVQVFIDEEEESLEMIEKIDTDYIRIARCLRTDDDTALFTLNKTELEKYDNRYNNREPPCAEDFRYGYNVTVSHDCLEGITDTTVSCTPGKYTFGEKNGSEGNSLQNQLTISYPVQITIKPDLTVPGTMSIEIRTGDLETLSGSINRVIQMGNETGTASSKVSLSNERLICSQDGELCMGGENHCVNLREDAGEFHLSPGSYILGLKYTESAGFNITGVEDGGC